MLSEEEQEAEMLDDLDSFWNTYRDMLQKGQTNVVALNTLIRGLKAVHRYYKGDDTKLVDEERNDK
jgi:hypothetical protein